MADSKLTGNLASLDTLTGNLASLETLKGALTVPTSIGGESPKVFIFHLDHDENYNYSLQDTTYSEISEKIAEGYACFCVADTIWGLHYSDSGYHIFRRINIDTFEDSMLRIMVSDVSINENDTVDIGTENSFISKWMYIYVDRDYDYSSDEEGFVCRGYLNNSRSKHYTNDEANYLLWETYVNWYRAVPICFSTDINEEDTCWLNACYSPSYNSYQFIAQTVGGYYYATKDFSSEDGDADAYIDIYYRSFESSGGATYNLSMLNNTITLTGSDGSTSSITLPVYDGSVSSS